MNNYNQDNPNIFSLEIDEHAKHTFIEMARWTKFLSIMGFIFLGLMLLGGVAIAMLASSLPSSSPFAIFGPMGTLAYFLVIVAVTFYPVYALMKFSTGIKPALNNQDKFRFNAALTSLKNTFKYYGILMIAFIGLYGIIIVVAVIYNVNR